jgi:hypothetical protein
VLQVPALVQFAHTLPALPGKHTARPWLSWHIEPAAHVAGWVMSQSARQMLWVVPMGPPTQASPLRQPLRPPATVPHGCPSSAISVLHAQAPPPVCSGRHTAHDPGLLGLQAAWQLPLKQVYPSAHWPLLQGWHSPGSTLPFTQAESLLTNLVHTRPPVQALAVLVHAPHWVLVAPAPQQVRQKASPLPVPTQAPHALQ